MEKFDNMKWFLRIALVFFATMLFTTAIVSQNRIGNPNNSDIYGEWISSDGEHKLYMNYLVKYDLDNFVRISPDGVHSGTFDIDEKFIIITKGVETGKTLYKLLFYLDGLNLIVIKPESEISEGEAWLFKKISNKQTEY
tara:strand:+ start:174 stop:590 length:417 start_codon:yes stop_codon:yes gene_type:complete